MSKRESFTNRLGFILACIGSAVGMGNIWMFPTRVSLYGGGSYLIPYFIFVVLIASTGVIGEMSFGRGTRSGPIDAFGAACESRDRRKVGETLGFIPVLGSLAMAIGYTVVMGWILKYMIGTFTGSIVWWNGFCLRQQSVADHRTCSCCYNPDVRCRKWYREGK